MWHFVYILKNKNGDQYVGHTSDINDRLKEHNEGSVDATKSKRPWHVEWFCGFRDEKKAIAFEKHMKTGSGSAFRFKHFARKNMS
ncbi:GIY-YIG nuclease family protein [Candidatus Peregrinibacteria bacterium]|nr:GIY-YIG nuclease family protein [Candidatus Peregrinibacteria bacterium]